MQPFTVTLTNVGATVVAGNDFNVGSIATYVGGYIMSLSVSVDNGGLATGNFVHIGLGAGGAASRLIASLNCTNDNSPQYTYDFKGGEDRGGLRIAAGETNVYIRSVSKNIINWSVTVTIWPP